MLQGRGPAPLRRPQPHAACIHLLPSIPSAACTAFVVTPTHFSLSCCPSVPEDEYAAEPSCWEEGGGVGWVVCGGSCGSQVLGSTERARAVVPVKRSVVQAQPGLASPCLVSAQSFLPSPFSPALDPAEGGQQ